MQPEKDRATATVYTHIDLSEVSDICHRTNGRTKW